MLSDQLKSRTARAAVLLLVLMTGLFSSAYALGPLDGEVGLDWWSAENDGWDDSFDTDTINGFAEVWWDNKWGVKGQRYSSDLEDVGYEESEHLSIDLKRRFFSLTDNSFFAVGAGWEEIDLDDAGSSSGFRITAEGRFGLGGTVYLYGMTSWLPELQDAGARSDLEGQAFEAGVNFDPAPFVSLRLGFRRFKLNYNDATGGGSTESDGFIFGAGVHW